MPRPIRLAPAGLCFHVINRGNGRATVFHKAEDYEAFLRILALGCERIDMRLLAWCLMPNHFHLVLWPLRDGDLARWMQWVTTCHVRRYHRHYKGSGHVWQGRYKAFVAQDTTYLLTLLRYVERNPVRAGLAARAEDWAWSSARFAGSGSPGSGSFSAGRIADKVPDPMSQGDTGNLMGSGTFSRQLPREIEPDPGPDLQGSMGSGTFLGKLPPKKEPDPRPDPGPDPYDPQGYLPRLPLQVYWVPGPVARPVPWLEFVNLPESEKDLKLLRASVNRGTPLGELAWQQEIGAKLGLESTLRRRGRPAKQSDL